MPLDRLRTPGTAGPRAVVLAAAVVAVCVIAGPASARLGGSAREEIACGAGLKHAIVDGQFTCLRAGERCAAAFQADYVRSGLFCRAGKLRRRHAWPLASPGGATRANPVPLGQPGDLGNGWRMTVSSVLLDASSALLPADAANKPPRAGAQYVLVSVSASYLGPGGSHLNLASSLRAAGASNANYTTFNSNCGVLPTPNLDLDNPLVFTGGAVAGYGACWSVPKSDLATLVAYYQPPFAKTHVWFALR